MTLLGWHIIKSKLIKIISKNKKKKKFAFIFPRKKSVFIWHAKGDIPMKWQILFLRKEIINLL